MNQCLTVLLAALVSPPAPSDPELTHVRDYRVPAWVESAALSGDGRLLAYVLDLGTQGTREVVVMTLEGRRIYESAHRGSLLGRITFTDDSRYLQFEYRQSPADKTVWRARIDPRAGSSVRERVNGPGPAPVKEVVLKEGPVTARVDYPTGTVSVSGAGAEPQEWRLCPERDRLAAAALFRGGARLMSMSQPRGGSEEDAFKTSMTVWDTSGGKALWSHVFPDSTPRCWVEVDGELLFLMGSPPRKVLTLWKIPKK
jgi:hypothetical protein